jgi:hypothetical protein
MSTSAAGGIYESDETARAHLVAMIGSVATHGNR